VLIRKIMFPVALLAWALPVNAATADADVVMTVNQQIVSQPEFAWFMEQERAGIFEYFKATCNLEDGKDFWTHECAGTTPRAMLQRRTVDRVTREKVEQILFQELGLIQDLRYSSFLENLEKLNRQREEAKKNGQVLYGPVRYTQRQFYGHWKASLQIEAKAKLALGKLAATDQAVRAFYDQSKERFRAPAATTLEVITIQPGQGSEAGTKQSVVKKIVTELEAGHSTQEVLQRYGSRKDMETSFRRFEALDDERIGELFSGDTNTAKVLALSSGQCVSVTGTAGAVQVVRCISRTAADYLPFEDVKGRVRARYLDKQYEQLVADMAQSAIVERNQKVIESLSPPTRNPDATH
jgi:hypothetical protein